MGDWKCTGRYGMYSGAARNHRQSLEASGLAGACWQTMNTVSIPPELFNIGHFPESDLML